MNKVETKQDINNLLNEFIEAIHFYDKEVANSLYEKVKLINRDKLDQTVLDKLHLFLYRYYLFIHDFERALEVKGNIEKRVNDLHGEDQCIFECFNSIYEISNSNFDSLEYLSRLLENARYKLPTYVKSDIYYHLCWGYVNTDDYKRSMIYGNKALDIYLGESNFLRIIYTQMLLTICYTNLGFIDEADTLYKHLIRNARLFKLNNLIPHLNYNHCVQLKRAGNYQMAVDKARSILDSFKNDDLFYILTILSLAEGKIMNRDLTEVKELIDIAKERSSKNESFQKYYLLSIYYEKKLSSEYDAYKYLIDTLSPYLLENNEKKMLFDLTKIMGDYFIKQGNYELASNYYELNLSLH